MSDTVNNREELR
ncbi:unnamed protein product, partial [Adineta steineri]